MKMQPLANAYQVIPPCLCTWKGLGTKRQTDAHALKWMNACLWNPCLSVGFDCATSVDVRVGMGLSCMFKLTQASCVCAILEEGLRNCQTKQ